MKSQDRRLARRYARAYISGSAADEASAKLDSLKECSKLLSVFGPAFSHPVIPVADKISLLRNVLNGAGKYSASAFLELLLRKKRFGLLALILSEAENIADAVEGRARARVRSAGNIDESMRSRLQEALNRLTGMRVLMEFEKSPGLVGGLEIRIGDRLYDYSVAGKLKSLYNKIINT